MNVLMTGSVERWKRPLAAAPGRGARVEAFAGDVRDGRAVEAATDKMDVVVHDPLRGDFHQDGSWRARYAT
jgi:hypothetical protein